jgi:hypothetical protein
LFCKLRFDQLLTTLLLEEPEILKCKKIGARPFQSVRTAVRYGVRFRFLLMALVEGPLKPRPSENSCILLARKLMRGLRDTPCVAIAQRIIVGILMMD